MKMWKERPMKRILKNALIVPKAAFSILEMHPETSPVASIGNCIYSPTTLYFIKEYTYTCGLYTIYSMAKLKRKVQ